MELSALTMMQAAPCPVHEEDDLNPLACFGGGSFDPDWLSKRVAIRTFEGDSQ
jgi:hypothetical protein